MLRFITYALPLLILLLASFGFAVELLDAEPRPGSVIRLTLFEQPRVPAQLVLGAWLVEASGLLALFLLAQGRCGAWWLDGLVAGWLAWIFRGPLLVLTIVVAARQSHEPWWSLAFGWWILYSVCGLALAWLARRTLLAPPTDPRLATTADEPEHQDPEPLSSDEPAAAALPGDSKGATPTEPTSETELAETERVGPELADTEPTEDDPSSVPVEEARAEEPPPPSEPTEPQPSGPLVSESDPSDDPTADGYETTVDESATDVENEEVVRDPADASDREDGRGDT